MFLSIAGEGAGTPLMARQGEKQNSPVAEGNLMHRIVVTGASGLVGFRLMQVLGETGPVWGFYHQRKPDSGHGSWVPVDLRDRLETHRVLDDLRPSTIIHCAAYSDPVYCEHHPQEANALNLGGSLYVAEWASRNACFLIHLSTDLVFDGKRGAYREEDDPHPVSVYGWTKLAAELAVCSSRAPYAVIRTSLIYGRSMGGNRGADEKLISSWKEGKETLLYVDEYRSPTAVGELALVITDIARRRMTGIWHVAGAECLSRYELGIKVARTLGYSEKLLIPKSIDEVESIPPRTPNGTLNIDKIQDRLGFSFAAVATNLQREHGGAGLAGSV
jgi:dTDP-4-dehydrorhamnose reductase